MSGDLRADPTAICRSEAGVASDRDRQPDAESPVFPRISVKKLGRRKLLPRLRYLIDRVSDEDFQAEESLYWAIHAIQLGRFVERHREECFGRSILHNLCDRREQFLRTFMADWDAMGDEFNQASP